MIKKNVCKISEIKKNISKQTYEAIIYKYYNNNKYN